MRLRYGISQLLTLSTLIIGCGEEKIDIATSAQLRVSFANRLVSVSFDLRPETRLRSLYRKTFQQGDLIMARASVMPETPDSPARLTATAAPDNLRKAVFDETDRQKFPNWKKLPRTVPSGGINILKDVQDSATIEFLYQDHPYLIVGGSLKSKAFDDIPVGFLAHQYFEDSNGNITASLSLAGPTLLSDGGIYFIGYYGLNPFVLDQTQGEISIPLVSLPTEIESWGLRANLWRDPFTMVQRLEDTLSPWRAH